MIDKDKTRQFTVTLGECDYRDLQLWAFAHGKTPAEYASQILAARIETNQETILKLIRRNKDDYNKSL
jgi:hypothetical protein